jgi:hypothetical protein
MLRDGPKGTRRDATIACRLSLYPLKRNSLNRNPGSSRVSRSIHRLRRRNAGRPPVAVGMPVARHPPHRSVLALLTHTVLTLDDATRSQRLLRVRRAAHVARRTGSVSGTGFALRVLLGQRPSLHDLLRPSLACVRPLRWYYAAVRLPMAVHLGLIAHRLLPAFRPAPAAEGHRVSRFSRVKFPCVRGVYDSAGPQRARVVYARCRVAFRLA